MDEVEIRGDTPPMKGEIQRDLLWLDTGRAARKTAVVWASALFLLESEMVLQQCILITIR